MNIVKHTYTLRENAYVFLNESLENASEAETTVHYWSFALIHIIQSIELICKYLLYREHKILVYENIDNPRNTVVFLQSIARLKNILGINFEQKEETVDGKIITRLCEFLKCQPGEIMEYIPEGQP